MQGIESQEDWSPSAATSAFLGMGISFLIWWWYFDGASGASEQPVRTKREAVRFHIWSYAHFPLYLGIVVAGVGIQRIVTAASRGTLTTPETTILTVAIASVMLAMTTIGTTSAGRRRPEVSGIVSNIVLAAATLAIGVVGQVESPVALIVVMATLCLAQLRVSLAGVLPTDRLGPAASL